MKVREGRLTDADRELIVAANREQRLILVASVDAIVHDKLGPSGDRGADQYVGIPQSWDYDNLRIGSLSGSYEVVLPWESIRGVWLHDDAPLAAIVAVELQ